MSTRTANTNGISASVNGIVRNTLSVLEQLLLLTNVVGDVSEKVTTMIAELKYVKAAQTVDAHIRNVTQEETTNWRRQQDARYDALQEEMKALNRVLETRICYDCKMAKDWMDTCPSLAWDTQTPANSEQDTVATDVANDSDKQANENMAAH